MVSLNLQSCQSADLIRPNVQTNASFPVVVCARLRLSAWPRLQTVLGVVVFTVCALSPVWSLVRHAARQDACGASGVRGFHQDPRDPSVVKLDVKSVAPGRICPTVLPHLLKVGVWAAAIGFPIVRRPPRSPEYCLDLRRIRTAHLDSRAGVGG